MDAITSRLKKRLDQEELRSSYADALTNALVAAQIRELREERDLSQDELASLIGTKQSGISRLEKADYSSWKVKTLRKLANAFGVRLRISFEEFGTLVGDIEFSDRRLRPRRYQLDPVFNRRPRTPIKKQAQETNEVWKQRLLIVQNPESNQAKQLWPDSESMQTGTPPMESLGDISGGAIPGENPKQVDQIFGMRLPPVEVIKRRPQATSKDKYQSARRKRKHA